MRKKKEKKEKKPFQDENKVREFLCSQALSRFNTIRKRKVFAVSVSTLMQEVFGIEKKDIDLNISCIIYLLLRGESVQEISKNLMITSNNIRIRLCRFYEKIDVKSAQEMTAKVFLWFIQRKKIILIPSDEKISKALTEKEIKEIII